MLNYRLIATDLDGTLLNHAKRVSQENLLAIHKYVQKGGLVAVNSGRTFTEIPEEVRNLSDVRYIIFSDGSGIYDRVEDTFHYEVMEQSVFKAVLDILKDYFVSLTIRMDGVSYVDVKKHDREIYASNRMPIEYQDFVFQYSKPKENFQEFCNQMPYSEMICAYFRSDKEIEECKNRLSEINEIKVVSSDKTNIEIISKNAGKGNGLKKVSSIMGISVKETISVGDTMNDFESIEMAGLGLAMGNSWEELKVHADKVVCTNEEHVMDYILKNIVL